VDCIGTSKANIFFELHVKFEEIYTDAQLKIDLIAERVLTLGFTPMHTFSDYLKNAKIKEGKKHHRCQKQL
jgi:starvation-inducible DNA-binding protein